MNKIHLIEDHDQALNIWRQKKIFCLDLVHIDAHMDFGFYQAKPIKQVVREAKSLKELKENLEQSIAFKSYESDFNKQTNIGNYIYPAMQEGLVNNFYWVVPGGLKEFNESGRFIKSIIKNLFKNRNEKLKISKKEGLVSFEFLKRKFVICLLEKLPILSQNVLLDIDTDFLVVNSLLKANNTAEIKKRKPWIIPKDLVCILSRKIKKPQIITIAYSVNGGYTPMCYKILGDELAYCLSPTHFKTHYNRKLKASLIFNRFELNNGKNDYQHAVKLNPDYQAKDNNYGPLYLAVGKVSCAEKEFLKITKVDSKNPYPLSGIGEIYLRKNDFLKAKKYFTYALSYKNNLSSAVLGLAIAEFKLNKFKKAKILFLKYKKIMPLDLKVYYFLGCINEKQKLFKNALRCYQDSIRLGLNDVDIIRRILKISCRIKLNNDIIYLIGNSLKYMKKSFVFQSRDFLKKRKEIKKILRLQKRLLFLENKIKIEGRRISVKR